MSVLVLLLVVGTAFVMSGCATCCGGPAPVKASKCAFGVQGCDKGNSAIWIEKSMPEQVVVGKPFEYTIQVTNLRSCALEDVAISERASEGLTIQSGEAELKIGTMKPHEVRQIKMTAVANAGGTPSTCTKADYKPVLCCGLEAISPSLKVVLEAPSQALLCDLIPVKVTVTNTGTGNAQNVKVTQALPQGLTTHDGKTSLVMDAGTLAGGASKSYTVNLKAAQSGDYSNSASAAAASGITAASGAVTTSVVQPVLKVGVSGPGKIFVTKNADFKVDVQNTGNADSANTTVMATIPAGMRFVGASNGGAVSGNSVVWNIGTLPAGKGATLDMTFNAVSGGTGESIARATGTCCQEANAAVKSDVEGIPAILLEVVDTEDPIQVGAAEKYYITVTNQGSAPDNNIVVKVNFEDNLDYVSSSGPTQGQSGDVKSVAFAPLATLGAGQRATWEVTAKAVKEGDHRTTVVMTSDVISRPVQETEATRIY